jgi:hypothetical protein
MHVSSSDKCRVKEIVVSLVVVVFFNQTQTALDTLQ